jgi:organic hydroperoxide reductase OsmC/OhrA
MDKLDKVIYTARVHTTGGRDGNSKSDDGKLEVRLTPPAMLALPPVGLRMRTSSGIHG